MADICLHIIGAGRAASTLAAAWRTAGVMSIGQILNRSAGSAERAASMIGAGQPCADWHSFCQGLLHNQRTDQQQWLLLGTPDDAIADVAQSLRQHWQETMSAELPLTLVFHLSGQLGAQALGDVADWPGAVQTAAAHPVLSFAHRQRAQQQLSDSFCVFSADDTGAAALMKVFAQLGMQPLQAAAGMDRASYHAALVLVSNYQCALHYIAEQLLRQAGFAAAQSRLLLGSLASTVAANLTASDSLAALTGPLERGDVAATGRLLQACVGLSSSQRQATFALAQVVLDMASSKGATAKGSPSEQQLQAMQLLLNQARSEPS